MSSTSCRNVSSLTCSGPCENDALHMLLSAQCIVNNIIVPHVDIKCGLLHMSNHQTMSRVCRSIIALPSCKL